MIFPPLTRLARADADQLAVDHVPLVAHIVRETMARVPAHVDKGDLNSAGLAALVTASRSFEPDRGLPFAAYAARRVRGAIMDELRGIDWASRSVRRRNREVEDVRTRLAARLGQVPGNAQVAATLGLTLAEVERSDENIARASVLSLQGGADNHYIDVLTSTEPQPDQALELTEQMEYLEDAVAELPERLRLVIRGYFIDERPMAELATELGVSESRISQLRAEALLLLRDGLNSALDPALVAPHSKPDGCVARRRDTYFRAVAERHAAAGVRSNFRTSLDASA